MPKEDLGLGKDWFFLVFSSWNLCVLTRLYISIDIKKPSLEKKGNEVFLSLLYCLRSWLITLESPKFSCLCPDLFFFYSIEKSLSSSSTHPQFVEKRGSAMKTPKRRECGRFSWKTVCPCGFVLPRVLALLGSSCIPLLCCLRCLIRI